MTARFLSREKPGSLHLLDIVMATCVGGTLVSFFFMGAVLLFSPLA